MKSRTHAHRGFLFGGGGGGDTEFFFGGGGGGSYFISKTPFICEECWVIWTIISRLTYKPVKKVFVKGSMVQGARTLSSPHEGLEGH